LKRNEALSKIRHCGYMGDYIKAELIASQKKIGGDAAKRAYLNGQKTNKNGLPCDCTSCKAKRSDK